MGSTLRGNDGEKLIPSPDARHLRRPLRLSRPHGHRAPDGDAPRAVHRRAVAGDARHHRGRPYQEPVPQDKKGALFLVTALEDAVIELKSLHRLHRRRRPLLLRLGRADARDAGHRARRGDAVRGHERHGRRVGVVLDRPDGARNGQLSPARQHHDHVDRARRSAAVSGGAGHPPRIVAVALCGEAAAGAPQQPRRPQ